MWGPRRVVKRPNGSAAPTGRWGRTLQNGPARHPAADNRRRYEQPSQGGTAPSTRWVDLRPVTELTGEDTRVVAAPVPGEVYTVFAGEGHVLLIEWRRRVA